MKSITALNDLFILYLLGNEENEDLLVSFINGVLLDSKFKTIHSAKVKNPVNIKKYRFDKETVLDIKAVDNNNRLYDIEIQVRDEKSFAQRSLYYWARLYATQIKQKETYTTLHPVICINLVNFKMFPDATKIHSCFMLLEKDNPEYLLTDHLEMHFIELKKYIQPGLVEAHLDKWLTFFKYEGKEEDKMTLLLNNDPEIRKAHSLFKKFNNDERLRDKALRREIWQLDYNTGLDEAMQEGIQKGKLEGKIEDAKNFKRLGVTVDIISKATGLSIVDIEKL